MQKQSETITLNVRVNSLTLKDIDRLARVGRASRGLTAGVILRRGFSNLKRAAQRDQKASSCGEVLAT